MDSDYKHFIQRIIEEDNRSGKFSKRVHTRFPPEPNSYLHIGHVKSIYLNYELAKNNGGKFNLRFDDTNPKKEEAEFVRSIIEDVKWLGADWEDRLFFASDYFQQMFDYANQLIRQGDAYVCDLSSNETREMRGTLKVIGQESPYRTRTVDENLDLFKRMRAGEFPDGSRTLRAKIDMSHANLNMRDPIIYRIVHATHHRTGSDWCIYPMYDWAHGLEDSIEGITHSICTLEFEDHRPLYDWYLDKLNIYHPQQIEFARLNVSYTITSKRKLKKLIEEGHVSGYDDPRLPTISGLKRRGYTPESLRNFTERVGVAKREYVADMALLEHSLREELNIKVNRVMAVLNPLKIVIENYPESQVDQLEAINNPEDDSAGKRLLPFSKEIFIERDDFMEEPPKKYFRLGPGREVRLRYAYFIRCQEVIKDKDGTVVTLICTYDPETKGGSAPDGRKVRGTLHWVSAAHAVDAEVRLYDRLFTVSDPGNHEDVANVINSNSLKVLTNCKLEPSLINAKQGDHFQFERLGYFCVDYDSRSDRLVFNRTVSLRNTWAKIEKLAGLLGKK